MAAAMRLVRAELHLMDAALEGDDALARTHGHDVVAGWATFPKALQSTRDALAADPNGSDWGARLFVAGDPAELVLGRIQGTARAGRRRARL